MSPPVLPFITYKLMRRLGEQRLEAVGSALATAALC